MAATEDASHRPEQGGLCIATARQRINRDGESSEEYAKQVDATAATEDALHGQSSPDYTLLRLNGCDSSCIATDSRADYARIHASRLLEQDRLCIATAAQRQRHIMHRDGESSADYA